MGTATPAVTPRTRTAAHGSTVAQVATQVSAPWYRWLLIAVLTVGVLAMHHLPDAPAATRLTGAAGTMTMTPLTTVASDAPGGPVTAPGNGEDCPVMDMMGHPCLAVLDTAHSQPSPVAAPGAPFQLQLSPLTSTAWSSALGARAPPPTVAARLSQLGAWRR